MKRPYGTGQLYEKSGSFYGRWRTPDGRRLNRRIGSIRAPGDSDGITRAQAERMFRKPVPPGSAHETAHSNGHDHGCGASPGCGPGGRAAVGA